ncbi:MAG TPA: DUF935 family protein [Verrucomicrobiae bacterium]
MKILERVFSRWGKAGAVLEGPVQSKRTDESGGVSTAGGTPAAQALQRIVLPRARDRWMSAMARSYTPEMIHSVLRSALSGNLVAQWELFDLMEDTWPRLQKNLNDLKDAVCGESWAVQPYALTGAKPSREAVKRAKLLEQTLWRMNPRAAADENGFNATLKDIADAWGKGIAVLEVHWEQRAVAGAGQVIAPRCTTWVHPRYYGYAQNSPELMLNLRELSIGAAAPEMLKDAGEGFAVFPPDKFLIAIAKHKSGHPVGGALLRPLAWWWCASNFSAEWLLNFAQLFGLPLRWASYDPNQPGLLNKICDMLENMGSSAWAAFPAGTKIELHEPSRNGTDNPQAALLDRADKQCDLLILGQTLTSEAGDAGSRALGEVHQRVRADRKAALAAWTSEVLQQLSAAFCRLNFGDDLECPWLQPVVKEVRDAKAMAERDRILLEAGVELPKAWFYERHEIPMPNAGEDVVARRANEEIENEEGRMKKGGNIERPLVAPGANEGKKDGEKGNVQRPTSNVERPDGEKVVAPRANGKKGKEEEAV